MKEAILEALNFMPTYGYSGDARRILIKALLKEGVTPEEIVSKVPSCFFTTEIESCQSVVIIVIDGRRLKKRLFIPPV